MKNIKYFDCSINDISNKSHNNISFGSFENDIMRDLGLYANNFGFERTHNYKNAEIIITNTLYPDYILNHSEKFKIPLIKRMDGIYWKDDLLYKNEYHNNAALLSNHVIFISEYSKTVLKTLYNLEPINNVVLNNVNDLIFYRKPNNQTNKLELVTSCTNWIRFDKRFDALIEFSKNINENIHLIGHCDAELPKNIIKYGYINNLNKISEIIQNCDIFLSLFFRDAGSKATCQAIQCGLPVLYSETGGLPEIVKNYGVSVPDYNKIDILSDVPSLNIDNILSSYNILKDNYVDIKQKYTQCESYQSTLGKYFDVMLKYI